MVSHGNVIGKVRAFNRFYTRVIGVLGESVTQTAFSLPEARVLFELNNNIATSAGDVARAMDVDPAYVSRILNRLSDQGLIAILPSTHDRRRNEVHLTGDGKRACAELDAAAEAAVGNLLEPLDASQRQRLVSAMRVIHNILEGQQPGPLLLRPARSGEVSYAIARQSAIYAKEYGWDESYEVLAASIAAKFLAQHDPKREICIVAELAEEVVGSVFIVDAGERVAQLRLLYVEAHTRGHGIGGRLVSEAVRFAVNNGYTRMRLWTQQSLEAARAIYAREGFTLESAEPHHSFGKDLVGEWWGLEL